MEMQTQEVVYKKVKAPLTTEEMKEAFLNKGRIKYIIDYKNSSLKTDVLLMFLSNLEIEPEFDLEGVPTQEKLDFIATYMKSKAIINSVSLSHAVAQILLSTRGVEWESVFPRILSDEEIAQFATQHKEMVERWSLFIDSTLLVLIRAFDPQISLDEFEEVQDAPIGMNVTQLLQVPAFYDAFLAAGKGKELKWFTTQFETPYFKGKNLISFLNRTDNTMFIGMNGMANGVITPAMLSDVEKELDEIERERQSAVSWVGKAQ